MWANFTVETKEAVFHAQELAILQGSSVVEPEHLLLAFPEAPSSKAMKMLLAVGISEEAIRERFSPSSPSTSGRPKDMVLGPRAKQVIAAADLIARARKDEFIGTDHLLLAIVKDKTGPAGEFLIESGANLTRLQEVV